MKRVFEDAYVKFASDGITLLRNNFEYQKIHSHQIEHMSFRDGFRIRNWLILFIIGIGIMLVCARLLFSINFKDLINITNSGLSVSFKSYFSILVSIIVLLITSLFLIISSLRRCRVVCIVYVTAKNKTKKKVISLRSFEKNKQMTDLIIFLKNENYLIEES